MTVRSRLLRAGIAAVTVGGFALAGIGVVAGPAGAIGGETAVQSVGGTFPGAASPANPIVPGRPESSNAIAETLTLHGDATANFGAIAFSIPIPAHTTFFDSFPGGWTTPPLCTPGGLVGPGTVSCTGGVLNAGLTATIDIVYELNHDYPQPSVDFSPAYSAVTGFDGANQSIAPTGTGLEAAADIVSEAALTATATPAGPQSVFQGGNSYTQTFGVSNAGPSDAVGVKTTVTAPTVGGVAIPSTGGTGACVGVGTAPFATYTCTFGLVTAGLSDAQSITWAVPATATAASAPNPLTSTNTISAVTTASPPVSPATAPVSPNAAIGTSASATANIVQPLSITKTGPTTVVAGSASPNVQYTVTAASTVALTAAKITDAVPAGESYVGFMQVSGAQTLHCVLVASTVQCSTATSGAAAPFAAETDVVSLQFQVPAATAPTTIHNVANFVSTGTHQVDTLASNSLATAVTNSAVLSVAKAQTSIAGSTLPADEVPVGGSVTYTITVSNAGPSNATTAKVVDAVSATASVTVNSITQTSPVTVGDVWTCTNATATCTNPSEPVGVTDTFSVVATVNNGNTTGAGSLTPGTPATFTNMATFSASDATTQTSTVTTKVNLGADIQATLTGPAHFPIVPGTINVSFGIFNAGPLTALNPTATLTLPAGVAFAGFVSTPPGSTCTPVRPGASGKITCSLNANLASGATATWVIQASYPYQSAGALPPVTVTNVVAFGAGTPSATVANFDTNTANNTMPLTTTAGSPPAPVNPTSTGTPSGRSPGGF